MRYNDRPFPSYRYVPGKAPHPTRDPNGHSYARSIAPFCVDEAGWRNCDEYLFAIDLFNARYYWESHELLEALWHGAGRESAVGRFAQGLIQAAAALLKASMDEPESASRLAAAAADKLRAGASVVLGVPSHALATAVERFVAGTSEQAPVITLDGDASSSH